MDLGTCRYCHQALTFHDYRQNSWYGKPAMEAHTGCWIEYENRCADKVWLKIILGIASVMIVTFILWELWYAK